MYMQVSLFFSKQRSLKFYSFFKLSLTVSPVVSLKGKGYIIDYLGV